VAQRLENTGSQRQGKGGRHRTPREPRAQRLPFHVFAGDESGAVDLAPLEVGGDAGMLQAPRRLGLAKQAPAKAGVEAGGQELQGHRTAECQVAGQEDLSHPALSDTALDPVVRNPLADQPGPPWESSDRSAAGPSGAGESFHLHNDSVVIYHYSMIQPKRSSWLLFIHQLPQKPDYLRVKVTRRLRALGARPIKNSVYVMPHSDAAAAFLERLIRDVTREGGEALLCQARFVAGRSDEDIAALFYKAWE